jgi:DNA-directed RNA polymerase subunit RPC12/RpoP
VTGERPPGPDESGAPAPARLACPRCGSDRLRRSAPRGLGERLVRSLSPLHRYRCRACGHRGWHLGPVGRARCRRRPPAVPGRPVERRDRQVRRARLLRAATAVAVAAGLGLAAGLVVQNCQQRVAGTARNR